MKNPDPRIPTRPLSRKDRCIFWVIVAAFGGVIVFVVYMLMR